MHECLYNDVMDEDARFRALASPVRRELLRLVRDDERLVGDLADAAGATQPATSQHLAVLRDAGLVRVRADGRRRWYRAEHAALRESRRFFDEYWNDAIDRLANVAEATAAAVDDAA